jgi:hypothetical protein
MLRMLESCGGGLKIRVSAVQLRPWPPTFLLTSFLSNEWLDKNGDQKEPELLAH